MMQPGENGMGQVTLGMWVAWGDNQGITKKAFGRSGRHVARGRNPKIRANVLRRFLP